MPEHAESTPVWAQPLPMAISTACTDSPLIATGEQGRGRAHSRKSAAAAAELRRQGAGSAANALVGTVSVQRQYPRGHQAVCTNRIATRRRLLRGKLSRPQQDYKCSSEKS